MKLSIVTAMYRSEAFVRPFHEAVSEVAKAITDEVEIVSTPRPGTAVAHDDGIVVVIDTTLTPELLAEGEARELTRAIQDLRKQAELALDARIRLVIAAPDGARERLEPHLAGIAADTLADGIRFGSPPDGALVTSIELEAGTLLVAFEDEGG